LEVWDQEANNLPNSIEQTGEKRKSFYLNVTLIILFDTLGRFITK